MDSLEWSKQFVVLTISRLMLRHQLGFTIEQVQLLTDEDMQRIADTVQENILSASNMSFDEEVRFITRVFLAEEHADVQTGEPDANE